MKKYQRALALLLALLLLAFTVMACGNKETPADTTDTTEPIGPQSTDKEDVELTGEAAEVAAEKGFGLADIPEISNKEPINVMVEASGSGDTIVSFIEKFAEKTGVEVTYEMIVMTSAYSKELNELQAGTGAYDLVMVETSWTNEWKDYLIDIGTAAEEYDPKGKAGLEADLENYDSGLLRCATTTDGVLMGLPYYSYPLFQYIRQDVFEDETEKAAFKEKYGYDLAPATTWDQIHDQGEFFTRKKGDTLKGEVLDHDIYGLAMMAGQFPHVQDEMAARIWGMGGHFATPVRDASGEITEFVFTKEDQEIMLQACKDYVEDMKYSPPGTENAFWDFAGSQFAAGNAIIMPDQYNGLWTWMVTDLAANVPGATVVAAPVPGMQPYTGGFFMGISKDSANIEASYWLARYIASYEAQYEMPLSGGWPVTRFDVVESAQANPDVDEATYHEAFGYGEAQIETAEYQTPYINDYLHFNSDAAGKLYDEMTTVFHENAVGVHTPEETVKIWGEKLVDVQNTYGSVPASVEE
ncbi:MAG: extracellular solute-binding protein [Lachnospiraceae bacterium]|jgi:multiple sugar transport system substrate-binding protein|nr:extracellular solute-binding protein [Lachnospiraceae bacterium]